MKRKIRILSCNVERGMEQRDLAPFLWLLSIRFLTHGRRRTESFSGAPPLVHRYMPVFLMIKFSLFTRI